MKNYIQSMKYLGVGLSLIMVMLFLLPVMVMANEAATKSSEARATAKPVPLAEQLKILELPANSAGASVAKEKLYSVQDRYVLLKNRFELSVAGSHQVTDTGFIATQEAALGARYYIDSKWSVGASYSYAFNELTNSTTNFYEQEGVLPKVPFVQSRADLTGRYLLFYGKFRLSMDTVLYFDHFVSLGPSMITLNTGSSIGAVAETGFLFWIGRNWNALFGVKNYVFSKTINNDGSKQFANQVQIYFSGGFLFGGI